MSAFGSGIIRVRREDGDFIEHVIIQRPLSRVLAFTGYSIDDVVNSPVARNTVIGYYRLSKWIERQSEIGDLERQWNRV